MATCTVCKIRELVSATEHLTSICQECRELRGYLKHSCGNYTLKGGTGPCIYCDSKSVQPVRQDITPAKRAINISSKSQWLGSQTNDRNVSCCSIASLAFERP